MAAAGVLGAGEVEVSPVIDAGAAGVVADLIVGAGKGEVDVGALGKAVARALDFADEPFGWERLVRGAEELHGVDRVARVAAHGLAGGGLRPVGLAGAQLCFAEAHPDLGVVAVVAESFAKGGDGGSGVAFFKEASGAVEGVGGRRRCAGGGFFARCGGGASFRAGGFGFYGFAKLFGGALSFAAGDARLFFRRSGFGGGWCLGRR